MQILDAAGELLIGAGLKVMREIIHSIAFPLVTELLYPTPLSAHVFSGLFGPTFFFLMVSQAVSPLSLTPRRFRVLKVSIMAVLPI